MAGDELEVQRDIRRAQLLLGTLRGVDDEESAAVLRAHAAMIGATVHEAALAVLAEGPTAGTWVTAKRAPARTRGARAPR